jgi:hypothetical protein
VYIKARLAREFAARPAVDLRGPFCTVAVKEGASEFWHLDWNDDANSITWIIPIGDWKGGEFCAPQLGIRVPIRPGQVLGVRARVIAHCSAPLTAGKRVVFTCFTDHTLLKNADVFIY